MNPDAHSTDGIFRIEVHRDGREARVAPGGELDLSTAGQLEDELGRALGQGCDSLVLDLRGLTFIDSSGVRLVANWAKRARDDGFDFAVTRGGANVHRVFELTGLANTLPFRA